MLGAEREEHAVVGSRGLELEVEALADALPERHAPRDLHEAAVGQLARHPLRLDE